MFIIQTTFDELFIIFRTTHKYAHEKSFRAMMQVGIFEKLLDQQTSTKSMHLKMKELLSATGDNVNIQSQFDHDINPPTYFSTFWWLISIIFLGFNVFMVCEYCFAVSNINHRYMYITLTAFLLALLFLIMYRFGVQKKSIACYKEDHMAPSDETDIFKPQFYYLLCLAVISYGIGLCLFELIMYQHFTELKSQKILTPNNLLQFIRFGSIVFYALHRIVRPSNRFDPLRTIFDLDIVEICLDAIDISVVFQIIFVEDSSIYPSQHSTVNLSANNLILFTGIYNNRIFV